MAPTNGPISNRCCLAAVRGPWRLVDWCFVTCRCRLFHFPLSHWELMKDHAHFIGPLNCQVTCCFSASIWEREKRSPHGQMTAGTVKSKSGHAKRWVTERGRGGVIQYFLILFLSTFPFPNFLNLLVFPFSKSLTPPSLWLYPPSLPIPTWSTAAFPNCLHRGISAVASSPRATENIWAHCLHITKEGF